MSDSYTGATTVNGGVIQLSYAPTLLNSPVAVNVNNGLTFGNGITAPTIGGLGGTGNFALQTTDSSPLAVALTVAGNGQNTYSGTLSGNGSLVVAGSGTQVLTGSSTFSGGVTVTNAGTLVVGGSAHRQRGGDAQRRPVGQRPRQRGGHQRFAVGRQRRPIRSPPAASARSAA